MNLELQSIFLEFFKNLGIEIETFSVSEESAERRIYRASIQTPDSKLLIGIHGKTLESISHLLTRMAETHCKAKCTVRLEVNDYLQSREARLHGYVNKKIYDAQESGGKVALSKLTPYERKLVHDYIQTLTIPGLKAESEGNGQERTLYITCPKPTLHKTDLSEDGIGI